MARAWMGGVYKRNGMYYAQWCFRKEKHVVPTYKTTHDEAVKVLNELTSAYRGGKEADVPRKLAILAESRMDDLPALKLAELWAEVEGNTIEYTQWGDGNRRRKKTRVALFVKWMRRYQPDTEQVRHVTKTMAESFIRFLIAERHLSNKTVNDYRSDLGLCFRITKGKSRIKENVWLETMRLERQSESKRPLTEDEVRAIFASLEAGSMDSICLDKWELQTLFAIAVYTGMRWKDCTLLTWENVDLDKNLVHAIPFKTKRFGTYVEIPLHHALKRFLLQVPQDRRQGYILPDMAARYNRCVNVLHKKIQKVFKRAGFQTTRDNGEGKRGTSICGMHSLRSTFISIALEHNIPLSTVAEIVGHHSGVAMTLHYNTPSKAALEAVNGAFGDYTCSEPPSPSAYRLEDLSELVADWSREELKRGVKQLQALLRQKHHCA